MKLELYIDEAGNTHTDWFNNEQPYFIYGGWLIDATRKYKIEQYINRLTIKKNNIELKSNIFRNKKNYKEFVNIFNQMINVYHAVPFFNISNKKFLIAAKIIEYFFDSKYNKSLNNNILSSNIYNTTELKICLASYILLNDRHEIISDFSNIIKNNYCSYNEILSIKEKLIELFSGELKIVANSLLSIDNNDLLKIQNELDVKEDVKFFNSIIFPVMNSLLFNLNKYLYYNKLDYSLSIYYDNIYGYDKLFEFIKDTWNINKTIIIPVDKDKDIIMGFKKLDKFESVNSKSEILIQLSDLLCGFVYKMYPNILKNKIVDSNIKIFCEFIKLNNEKLITINEDTETFKRLYKILGINIKYNYTDKNTINSNFKNFLKNKSN